MTFSAREIARAKAIFPAIKIAGKIGHFFANKIREKGGQSASLRRWRVIVVREAGLCPFFRRQAGIGQKWV